jgi:hypothetical protein
MEKKFDQFKDRRAFKSAGLDLSKFIVGTTAKFAVISAIILWI